MSLEEVVKRLLTAGNALDVERALDDLGQLYPSRLSWEPVGRQNNQGTIGASADPGRSLVERLTNGIDAVLEAEYQRHSGNPECRTPKEAATAWLGVPTAGLSGMSPQQRRDLARRVTISLFEGEAKDSRVVEVRDQGIGVGASAMPRTILSLGESNKMDKLYLSGAYGQGGSSTFAVCKYTVIASRSESSSCLALTVVTYRDLPPDRYKIGHYVYLVLDSKVIEVPYPPELFPPGTSVRHIAYDLCAYASPVGPNSVYGLLNQTLFDPVLPIWLDNRIHNYRRVIKGVRNALNGAVDEGDDQRRGPALSHNVPLFYVPLGEFGQVGIEYWVLERPTKENKHPSRSFINPSKPIILTVNGQGHAEISQALLRKEAELAFLTQRFICHVDCNQISATAKRVLFVSNREDARRGAVYNRLHDEIVRVLRSDDELTRLNNEARQEGLSEQDAESKEQMRNDVARLLRMHGVDIGGAVGGEPGDGKGDPDRPTKPRPPRPPPQPIDIHEPPTFIRIAWGLGEPITFYPGQRRYLRLETDARADYHDALNPARSRINVILDSGTIVNSGTTALHGGRMRFIADAAANLKVGANSKIRVELSRTGLSSLFDERDVRIVEPPPSKPSTRKVSMPPFDVRPVEGPEDEKWSALGWPDTVESIASSAETEDGKLVIYYSREFPNFKGRREKLERTDPALALSFESRYKVWLAVHSLILHQDRENADLRTPVEIANSPQEADDPSELRERQERCRIATLAALFSFREVQNQATAAMPFEE